MRGKRWKKETGDKYVPVELSSELQIYIRFGGVCSCPYLSSKVFCLGVSNTLPGADGKHC